MKSIKQEYIDMASMLGYGIDFTKLKTTSQDPSGTRVRIMTEIANRYVNSKDEFERSSCIAALMLMFLGEAKKMMIKCVGVTEYQYEDFLQQLYLCIQTACDYQAWKDGKYNVEQCIRSTIGSRGAARILYLANLDKNKANGNTMNLDKFASTTDDDGNTWLDKLQATEDHYSEDELAAIQVVQHVLDRNKIVEGIILDRISFCDSYKRTTEEEITYDTEGNEIKTNSSYREFNKSKIVSALNNLSDEFVEEFMKKYNVAKQELMVAVERVVKVNNQKKTQMIACALKVAAEIINA